MEEETRPERILGLRVALGFGAVVVLMASITVIGLVRLAGFDQQLTQIVTQNNVKTALVNEMLLALRDRAISMHTIASLRDPFAQQEEYERFLALGAKYRIARDQLESLPLADEETGVLVRIRELTSATGPVVEEAIRQILLQSISGQSNQAGEIMSRAIPAQKKIAAELDGFLKLQQKQTQDMLADARRLYEGTRTLMVLLAVFAGVISIAIAAVVIRNATRQAHLLQHQALFDSLTNLPNRTLLADRLQQTTLVARREQFSFALIALDLDGFKEINDTLGHHVGDQLLQEVGTRLRVNLRESDTVARMGGDEFTILLPTAGTIDGAVVTVKKLIEVMKKPVTLDGRAVTIGASFGVAAFPDHGDSPDLLLRRADAAMYAAKRSHGGFQIYSDNLKTDKLVTLQADLRRALVNDELLLHYQPKIDLRTETVTGVEALVRWQHPQQGLMYPDLFIPLSERTGLIKPLTLVVLRKALRQGKEWRDAGMSIPIAVNVSVSNVQDAEFPDEVARLLREFETPSGMLELEMTESAVMTEPARAVQCIKKLRELGVLIAIDDFGTGYSSMTYLRDLLVAKIKIDKSFVKEMSASHEDAVIVRSTVELGHNLGLKVIAEGVESPEVWEQLKTFGCDGAQGYYMSRPVSAEKFMEWLRLSRWQLESRAGQS